MMNSQKSTAFNPPSDPCDLVEARRLVVPSSTIPANAPIAAAEPAPAAPKVQRKQAPKTPRKLSLSERARRPVSAKEALKTVKNKRPAKVRAVVSPQKPHTAANPFNGLTPHQGLTLRPIVDRPTFKGVWASHRARALIEQDYAMVAMASVLIDAADRCEQLAAGEITLGGQQLATWVDTKNNVILGLAPHPAIWLADLLS